jgi:hypothetical protein
VPQTANTGLKRDRKADPAKAHEQDSPQLAEAPRQRSRRKAGDHGKNPENHASNRHNHIENRARNRAKVEKTYEKL